MSSANSAVWQDQVLSNAPIEVRLTDDQIEYCRRVGGDRSAGKRWGTDSTDLVGTLIEYAFQFIHSGFHNQFNGKILVGGDGGVDYFTPHGSAIDIKGSSERAKWMYVPAYQVKRGVSDLYVMGRWMGNHALFDGWITKEDFGAIALPDEGAYKCWISSMQPMEVFCEAITLSLL